MRRTQSITIMLTPQEKAGIEALARSHRDSMSAVVRLALLLYQRRLRERAAQTQAVEDTPNTPPAPTPWLLAERARAKEKEGEP